MKEKDYGVIIESPDDFENPFLVYAAIKNWMRVVEEDFADYNEFLFNATPFIAWLNGAGYITNEEFESLLDEDNLFGIMSSETLFPKTWGSYLTDMKCYQVASEYISRLSVLRERLYKACIKSDSLLESFNVNKDGVSIVLVIDKSDLTYDSTVRDFRYLNAKEQYMSLKKVSLTDCDIKE